MPSAGSTILAWVTLSTSTWRRTRRDGLSSPSRLRTSSSTLVPSAPWSRLAASSRLSPLTTWPGDLDDLVARPEPGLPRRPAADHADQPQALGSILSSMPRPTKLPSIMA